MVHAVEKLYLMAEVVGCPTIGDSRGKAMHFTAASVRYLWLDRAQHARRS